MFRLPLLSMLLLAAASLVTFAQEVTPAPPPTAAAVVIKDATPIKLRFTEEISSATAQAGENIHLQVAEDLKVGEQLVIPKGSLAIGTVTEAVPKRRMGHGGKLNLTIDFVLLAHQEKVPLRAVREGKGAGRGGVVAAGLLVSPLALFVHGKDMTIKKDTQITAYINGDTSIDPNKSSNSSPAQTVPPAAEQTTPPEGGLETSPPSANTASQATLEIVSTPPGAEIELDGSFAGNTPSTIGVQPGEHTITVSKPGYTPWKRTIKTTTGAIKLTPELQPELPK